MPRQKTATGLLRLYRELSRRCTPLAAVGIDYAMGIKLGFNIGVRRLETGEWICWRARARRTGSWMGLGDSCWSRGSTLYSAGRVAR
ncbi:MAG: hypothetical protein ACI8PG_000785 [Planctomycetota bacterium]|jgi:hypothetical protein